MSQEEIKMEIKKYLLVKKKTQHAKIWNAAKAVLQGKFADVNSYILRRGKISNQ